MADNIWTKLYSRINWKNRPSRNTPINETNLGKIDYALDEIDNRVIGLYGLNNELKADLNELKGDLGEYMSNHYNSFEFFDFTTGAYIDDNDGSLKPYDGAKYTDYIPVKKGSIISCSIVAINKISVAIAIYDINKNFIFNESIFPMDENFSSGASVATEGNIELSHDGFIRIARQLDGSELDTIDIVLRKSLNEEILDNNHSQWKDKNWICFGTSITDNSSPNSFDNGNPTGKYTKYLSLMSGLVEQNEGVSGGRIATSTIHDPRAYILERILETDMSNADLITIEGFVNDVTACTPLGELGSKDNGNLCGALSNAIEYCLTNSNALVVLLTDSVGKPFITPPNTSPTDYGITYKNELGLSIKDYNDMIEQVGLYYKIPVIRCGDKANIDEFHPEYIVDHIHHTELGGKQYAQTIWNELKNLYPLLT